MKKYIKIAILIALHTCSHYTHTRAYFGNIGFSLNWKPALFQCSPALKNCVPYQFTFSPIQTPKRPSTKDHEVSRGYVLTEQHALGYWAPKLSSLYAFKPMWKNTLCSNTFTWASFLTTVFYFYTTGNNASTKNIVNWWHKDDPNLNNNCKNGSYTYNAYWVILSSSHHDRSWAFIDNIKPETTTTIQFNQFTPPTGSAITAEEYFDGVGADVVAYFPLHLVDPGIPTYPASSDVYGFALPSILKQITNYAVAYANSF